MGEAARTRARAKIRKLRRQRNEEAQSFAAERNLFLSTVQQLWKDPNKPDLHEQEKED
jgi:hypothetical protein